MRIIVLGDTHGRDTWKKILANEKWDEAVFIGDYFDSWDLPGITQLANYEHIDLVARAANLAKRKVIRLVGNHDHHYFPEVGYNGCSGYQANMKIAFENAIRETRDDLRLAYQVDNFIFTHAGVSEVYMDEKFGALNWKWDEVADKLNDLWRSNVHHIDFNGRDEHGDNITQTPIWIRPKSLKYSSSGYLKKNGVIQVVGHTQQRFISTMDKGYYFIDTLGTSGEYLIIEDGEVSVGDSINFKELDSEIHIISHI